MAKSKKGDSMFSRFDALTQVMEDHMKKIREEAKVIVKTVIDELFVKHAELRGVQWDQYTQYFNDGDECHFYVHEVRAQIAQPQAETWKCSECNTDLALSVKFCPEDGEKQEIESSDDWHDSYDLERAKVTPALSQDIETLNSKIQGLDEAMKYAFGDHKRITITRDNGIDVEDYTSHD